MHYEVDPTLAALFETRFEAMWERATNRMATTPPSREGCLPLRFSPNKDAR
jgi:hypothetical protein